MFIDCAKTLERTLKNLAQATNEFYLINTCRLTLIFVVDTSRPCMQSGLKTGVPALAIFAYGLFDNIVV